MKKKRLSKRPASEIGKSGRPSKYNSDLGELICSLLSEGQSLRKICSLDNMPRVATVMNWLAKGAAKLAPYDRFLEQYTCGREAQAELLADEIIDISDDSTQDELFNDEGKRICNAEFVARSKLRVDARKWVASKLLPKKYGEKVHQELSTKDDKPIPIFTLNIGQKNSDA